MEPKPERRVAFNEHSSEQLIPQLIIKLRWIGLDEDAKRLESTALALPPEERCSVSFGPFSTD